MILSKTSSEEVDGPPCSEAISCPAWSIRFYFHRRLADPGERITLCSGTERAAARTRPQGPYLPEARVPKSDWRTLRREELSALSAPSWMEPGRCVGLFALPSELLSHLETLGFQDVSTAEECHALNGQKEVQEGLEELAEGISVYFAGQHEAGANRVAPKLSGLPTVSVDRDRGGAYNGLHVDNWSKAAISQRHLAPNRICINVGTEARYLLCLPVALQDAVSYGTADPSESTSVYALGNELMGRFPDFPVLRMRIEPGEAYVAPTENIIHDASTAGQCGVDLTFTLFGRFSFKGGLQ